MRELLSEARAAGEVDFEAAWAASWQRMVSEKSWPHATVERREWRAVLEATKDEFERCWSGAPSRFQRVSASLMAALEDLEELEPDEGVVLALALG
jgi:hypothetical protein